MRIRGLHAPLVALLLTTTLAFAGCGSAPPAGPGPLAETTTTTTTSGPPAPQAVEHAVAWQGTLPRQLSACSGGVCYEPEPGHAWQAHEAVQDRVRAWEVSLEVSWGESSSSPVHVQVFAPAGAMASFGPVLEARGTGPLTVEGSIDLGTADADRLTVQLRRDRASEGPVADHPAEPYTVNGTLVATLR